MSNNQYEAIIVGAGMGGMCVAAQLTGAGKKVLLLEKSRYLGGRCSHRVREESKVTTGALMIPMGPNSAIRQAFDAVGAEMDMVDLTSRMRYRLSHGDFDLPQGGGGLYSMIEFAMKDGTQAKAFFNHIQDALFHWTPLNTITILDWFNQYTDNQDVKDLFQGYCASLMGIGMHEIPAGTFFNFLKYSSKGSRFGMANKGNGALMETLAIAIEQQGSTIRRQAGCKQILSNENEVVGVEVNNSDGEVEPLYADIVISNLGPDKTVMLAGGEAKFERSYLARLHSNSNVAPIMHVSFLMDEPLIDNFNGCMVFGNNKNFIYLEIPSEISPEISPKGKYLHTAYGASTDAASPDLDAEMDVMLKELEKNFPGMSAKAHFLVKAKHRGSAPAMRRWAGYGMPVNTPIRGLFNVGDGCAPEGTIGTESAAASAREVANFILAQSQH
ncbi:MAG: phytoene dehydrogenase-like protein [Chitinophagales bacterium]|jgi:phytoene dehydrogenase-like protein